MKILVLMLGVVWSLNSMADTSMKCERDDRPADGNYVAIKIVKRPDGLSEVFYSFALGGHRSPSDSAPPAITDQLVASANCLVSDLDERVRQCANQDWTETVVSNITTTTEITVDPRTRKVSHQVIERLKMQLQSPAIAYEEVIFDPKDCKLF